MFKVWHLALLPALFAACSLHAQSSGGLGRRTPETVEQTRRADRRVTLDIQVTDNSGTALRSLPQNSFTLLDSGHPVALTSFRELDATAQPPTQLLLLVDAMSASFQDVVLERQGVDTFLRTNGGRLALPTSIVFLADTAVTILKPTQDGIALANEFRSLPTPTRVLTSAQGAYGAQDRMQRSFRTLLSLCNRESPVAGRKLLVWIGSGWPLLTQNFRDISSRDHARYFNSIVEATTALRRAHITLSNVAPLNLQQGSTATPFLYKAFLKGVTGLPDADSMNLALQVLATHSGGLVLNKDGNIPAQITLCAADSLAYYEVTFEAAEDPDIRYHALQVKLDRPGARVRTSTSYYGGIPQSTLPVLSAPSQK